MDPRKPFAENPEDERFERPADEFENEKAIDSEEEDDSVDVDEIIDKESYADRHHGRTNEGPADVSNPGTV